MASLLDEKLQSDVLGRIIGCQAQMNTFDFFFELNLGQRLFSHTDNLSRTLQQTKMSANKRVVCLTAQDYYRRIYFEAIDLMMNAMDQRFDQPSFDTYEKMESLSMKTLNSQDKSEELKFMELAVQRLC